MRGLSVSQFIGLVIGMTIVIVVLATHHLNVRYRLWRVRCLNRAGRLDEARAALNSVAESHRAFFQRHPGWGMAADRGREAQA